MLKITNKDFIAFQSVEVDERINDDVLASFIALNCDKFGMDKNKVRVFYCEGINTYEFYELSYRVKFLNSDIYASFYYSNLNDKYKKAITSSYLDIFKQSFEPELSQSEPEPKYKNQ